MVDQWKSKELYEHPAKHRAGTFGNVVLSPAGVYCLRVGASTMSCPQDWAAKVHKEEEDVATMIVRQITQDLKRAFKVKCAVEGVSQQAQIIELMRRWVEK